jgi:trigger factor
MQTTLETIGSLARKLNISVPAVEIDNEVQSRLKRLAQTVKMHGFRPGKVPFKVVAQQYGPQVRQEVLGDTLQQSFGNAVRDNNLRVAGVPRFESQPPAEGATALEYSATFEVYPEVKMPGLADLVITRPVLKVDEAEVDKTIDVLRKQRARYESADRPAAKDDLVTMDFSGTIDGVAFPGGEAKDMQAILGSGRLLPDFETSLAGLRAGESRELDIAYPADYHGKEVAGKTAHFLVTVKKVEEPVLPALDAEFAKSLGITDGEIGRMRTEVRSNVEREVQARVVARLKEQVFQALLDRAALELPQSLVDVEQNNLTQAAMRDLEARGVKVKDVPIPADILKAQAERRVRLGLILAEAVRANGLQAKPEQILASVEAHAASFEQPQEVVKWYYSSPERLGEFESVVLEQNVIDWVLATAKVEDKAVAFDELMGNPNA